MFNASRPFVERSSEFERSIFELDKNLRRPQNPCSVDATGQTHLYKDLPPMVARLEKTPRSVIFSGHDWILRKPAGVKGVQPHYRTLSSSPFSGK